MPPASWKIMASTDTSLLVRDSRALGRLAGHANLLDVLLMPTLAPWNILPQPRRRRSHRHIKRYDRHSSIPRVDLLTPTQSESASGTIFTDAAPVPSITIVTFWASRVSHSVSNNRDTRFSHATQDPMALFFTLFSPSTRVPPPSPSPQRLRAPNPSLPPLRGPEKRSRPAASRP